MLAGTVLFTMAIHQPSESLLDTVRTAAFQTVSLLTTTGYATADFEGITGTLTCDQYGDCADPQISVSQLTDGAYVPVWP